MKRLQNLAGGLAGALALNFLHETVRLIDVDAPRIELVGEEGLNKVIEATGGQPLEGRALYAATLAGDIVSNAVYYSAIGAGKDRHLIMRGAVMGLTAGIGALKLTKQIGLADEPIARTQKKRLLTVGYYLAGGLVTGMVIKAMRKVKAS